MLMARYRLYQNRFQRFNTHGNDESLWKTLGEIYKNLPGQISIEKS